MTNSNRVIVFGVALLIVASLSYSFLPVMAQSGGEGTLTLNLSGYALDGNLQNAIIQTNSVSMNMVVNTEMQISVSQVPITANGVWVGTLNGTNLSGLIQNVSGTVQVCFLFWCGQALFVGQGKWSGTLNSTQGSGIFEGTVTFTSSSISQIQVNQPAPITGTWNADFQLS